MINSIKIQNLLLIALVVVSILAYARLTRQNSYISDIIDHEKIPDIGSKASLFSEQTIDGKNIDIKNSDALLIFFDSACPTCVENVPKYQTFYKNHKSNSLQTVLISRESPVQLKKFIEDFQIDIPVISDKQKKIFWEYRVKYVPLAVLVGRDGRYKVYQDYGQPIEDFFEAVESYLTLVENLKK